MRSPLGFPALARKGQQLVFDGLAWVLAFALVRVADLTTGRIPMATGVGTLGDSRFADGTSGAGRITYLGALSAARSRTLWDQDGTEVIAEAGNAFTGANSFAGQTTFQDGSAAAPAIKRVGTNDGFFFGSGFIGFSTGGVERMRVDANGRLIIGNSSALSIGGQTAPNLSQYGTSISSGANSGRWNNDNNAYSWNQVKSRAGVGSFGTCVDGDAVHQLNWCADDGTSYDTIGARILATVTGTPAAGIAPIRLGFFSAKPDTGTTVEAHRVTPMGTSRVATVFGAGAQPLTTYTFNSGTNATQAGAQVIGSANTNIGHLALMTFNGNSLFGGVLTFGHALSNTYGTYTALASGNRIGESRFDGADGTALALAAQYVVTVDGTVSTGIVPGRHSWFVTDTAGASNEGLRLNSARQLITNGASAPAANAFPGHILYGVTDATAPVTGQIGEVVKSTISTATNAAASGAYLALTSISLTAGDWDIAIYAEQTLNGATLTAAGAVEALVGTTTASATGSVQGFSRATGASPGTGNIAAPLAIGKVNVQPTSTTTYYLNVLATYTAGTPQWRGSIVATRRR